VFEFDTNNRLDVEFNVNEGEIKILNDENNEKVYFKPIFLKHKPKVNISMKVKNSPSYEKVSELQLKAEESKTIDLKPGSVDTKSKESVKFEIIRNVKEDFEILEVQIPDGLKLKTGGISGVSVGLFALYFELFINFFSCCKT
jgi:hypothetical protein